MKPEKWSYRMLSAATTTALLLCAFVMFASRYNAPHAEIPITVSADKQLNRIVFLRTFYLSFAACAAALFGCIFSSSSAMRRISLIAGAVAAVLAVYIMDDFFTITIFMYLAHIMMASLVFPPRRSPVIALCCMAVFLTFLMHPPFMGLSLGGAEFTRPSFAELCALTLVMALSSALMIMLRHCIDTRIYDQETIAHLNFVETRLTLFNHRLQDLAKQRGEEAVKQERLRFTRDLHDSCGYAFSNIILASDAAVSRGEMGTAHSQEIFQQIRGLASRGLSDTRETLHLIRKIQEPYHKSIETVYQLKKIFEEVTGITVAVELGNMKGDYGPAINKVISRIIQEAFTNSIRHGRASRILIQFWELSGHFTMTVTDNGIGSEHIVKGIGLAGMEERLESVGGTLAVSSPPEGGFRLKIAIPLVYISASPGL